jgi:predicted phosphodiesterase
VLEVQETSLYVLHNLAALDLKPEAAGFGVVVYGHTHVAKQEVKNGVLYFNPGSAGPRRFRLPITVGRLTIKGGSVSGQIVEIVSKEVEGKSV